MAIHVDSGSNVDRDTRRSEPKSVNPTHDDGTSRNEVVNSTRDPIDDNTPGASFMLVGMSYPIIAAIVALVIALGIWLARQNGG